MTIRTFLAAVTLPLLVAGACSSSPTPGSAAPLVVVTTTVLGDIVRNVAGDDARVEVLLPIGADPHDHRLSARDVALINQADLVVTNGLGLEEGMADILAGAAADGVRTLEIAPLVDPLPFGHDDDDHDDDGHDHDDGDDPHVWMDPLRMAEAARRVAAELQVVHPGPDWEGRAAASAAELASVDARITAILDAVPAERRKLVTNHDALGYFAARYGFTVVGVVIPGGSTLAEPSSGALAALVATMRSEGIRAVFAETTDTGVLARAVAAELGDEVAVVDLFTGSLGGPGSGAETLGDMLLLNARRIADALG